MPRPKKDPQVKLLLAITPQLDAYLDDLLKAGLSGNSRQEVVRRVLGDAIEEKILKGTLSRRE